MLSVLIAPDSFKGTLTADEVCDIVEKAFKNVIKEIKTKKLPVADGGEGLCSCFAQICDGEFKKAEVCGVFGEKMSAEYYMLDDMTAVIEMSACAGLPLAGDRKNPEETTTFGVGELMLHAKENGAKAVLLGLGGSATNDCGAGMAAALGWQFFDQNGESVIPIGKNLKNIKHIKAPKIPFGLPVTAACDVKNPLYGKDGAAFVFAPQKGADEAMVKRLDSGLKSFSQTVKTELNIDVSSLPGAGAAGGMGAGSVAFLGAEPKRGIDIILEKTKFAEYAQKADVVISGEGRLDFQSLNGKVISGVADITSKLGKPLLLICGCKGSGAEKALEHGVSKMYFSCEEEKSMSEILKTCHQDLYNISARAAKDVLMEYV